MRTDRAVKATPELIFDLLKKFLLTNSSLIHLDLSNTSLTHDNVTDIVELVKNNSIQDQYSVNQIPKEE